MKIIISGLGRMGMQIAHKLAQADHEVIAHNRSHDKIDTAVAFGAIGGYSKEEAAAKFTDGEPVVLWIMLPAGIIEEELRSWFELIPQGSVIIDGGNSDYRQTRSHGDLVHSAGHVLLDVGTSGGIMGLAEGFCMMAGGDDTAYQTIVPVLETLAAPRGGYYHFGPSGSGHYTKMVHNAIEYGMMESLAEGYRMLKEGPYDDLNLAAAGNLWEHGSIVQSGLNRLTTEALAENPELDGISGSVAESGETRWTLETAHEKGIPLPSIQASFDVRLASQKADAVQTNDINYATKLLSAMRNKFGGHDLNDKTSSQT